MVHFILAVSVIIAFSKYKNIRLTGLAFIILSAFSALRYNFGNDYSSYDGAYRAIKGGEDIFKNEHLYTLLNKITPSFFLLMAITAAFFVWVVYRMVKEHTVGIYQGMAVLIFVINPYLFLMNLSAVRQCIAMCIFILALKYIQERKFLLYLLMIIMAALFHLSALVLIPVYFFVNDKPMSRLQTFLLVTAMLLLLLEGRIVSSLIETGLFVFDNSSYTHYFSGGTTNSLRATLLTGVYFAYVAINLVHLKGYKLICGKLYLVGSFLGMLAIHLSAITRIQMYFDVFSIIAIPAIIEYHANCEEGKWKRIINLYIFPAVLLVIYIARYYSFFANPMWSSFATYHTIFEALL